MNTRTQSFAAILIALLFSTTGFAALNSLNNLNQFEQTLGALSASIQEQAAPAPATNADVSLGGINQPQASLEVTVTNQAAAEPPMSNSALQIGIGETIYLLQDIQTITVSLAYNPNITSTDSITVQLQLLVAQNTTEALNVGHHSNVATIMLNAGITQTIPLYFETVPPTGSYKAQLVVYNQAMLATKIATLVVASQPPLALQHRLTDLSNDKQIEITGVRYWPWCDFSWNSYDFLLWEKYLRANDYQLVFSELADPVHGHFGQLGIPQGKLLLANPMATTESGTISISLQPMHIEHAGAYTGTFSIIDTDRYTTEAIPVIVRARDHWWIPFALIFAGALFMGGAGRYILGKADANIEYLKYRISVLRKRCTETPQEIQVNPAYKQILSGLDAAEIMLTLQDATSAKMAIDEASQKLDDLRNIATRLAVLRLQHKDKIEFKQAEAAFQSGDLEGAQKFLDTIMGTDQPQQSPPMVAQYEPPETAIKRIKRVAFWSPIVWALIGAVAGILYFENSLPTFGNGLDYLAALGWALGVGAVGTTAPAVLQSIRRFVHSSAPPQ
ncbi:MAG: hypothetical protein R3A44_18445 [Caldilineaceae bacterium]